MSDTNTQTRFQKLSSALKKLHIPPKVIFILVGVASTIWFLIRVIPKPTRATYPCMKVAAPFMSSLVIYLIGITGSAFFYKKALNALKTNKIALLALILPALIAFLSISLLKSPETTNASTLPVSAVEEAHPTEPIGEAKGINPGRVTWVYNSDATNKDMTNSSGDYWYEDKNVDEDEIEKLLDEGLKSLTGEETLSDSWDALFKHYNNNHSKGDVGYASGEKIFIKVNFTNSCCSNTEHRMDATPQVMVSLLKTLIEDAGIAQANITIGDPFRDFKDFHIAKCHGIYPDVHYIGPNAESPVEQTTATSDDILKFSDGQETARIAQAYVDADYFINMPCLKSHNSGGITIAAKNHQGSILAVGDDVNGQSAFYMHYALPDNSSGSGNYRHLVDYMGHEQLGGKNLLILVDGIWGGDNWEGNIFKWQMTPFNDDYPSSLILSQDPVAVEAVCYDILLEEYKDVASNKAYPYMDGTNDFLWQAASEDYWPTGITYDPEGDGTKIGSLGVYEHWNNATDRQYSRNLGTGNGIELIEISTKRAEYPTTITASNSELPSDQVNTVYVDSSNTVWIGTDEGLSRLTESGWKQYDTILLNKNVKDIAYELTAYGKELWIATDSGLTVSSYDDIDGVTGSTTYTSANSGLYGNNIATVDVDVDHNRWIGTDSAIAIFKGSDWDTITVWTDTDGEPFTFYEHTINDIHQNDDMAFVATNGKGIARMDYNEVDGFSGASTYGLPWASIASDSVNAIDVSDTIQWYATTEGANKHESPFTKVGWTTYDENSGLLNNMANSVYIDESNNAWVGTSGGISIILIDGGQYELTASDGLINDQVNHISGDIFGNTWVATSGGIQWFGGIAGNQTVLGIPKLVAPTDFEEDVELRGYLVWQEIIGAETYRVEVATDVDFNDKVLDYADFNSTRFGLFGLDYLTTYYWRIAANGNSLTGDWSETFNFITKEEEDQGGTSVNNIELSNTVLAYPNPASDNFHLEVTPSNAQTVTVSIYNLSGKLIEIPVNGVFIDKSGYTIDINVSDDTKYPGGIYILKVQGESFNQVSRLSIQ